MKTIQTLSALLAAMLFITAASFAQLIIPDITIDTQRIPEEAELRQNESLLDSMLTEYFADTRQEWNRDVEQYDLPVAISIYITDYTPNPQEDKYKANLIVTNKAETRYDDKRWEFGLRKPPYNFQPNQYNPLTSVIEFYIWMLIGIEEDKFEKFGGRSFFDKARGVTLNSAGAIYYFGWDKRTDLLREYTSIDNDAWRELNFFYYTGVYYDSEQDYAQAKPYLHYAIVKLEKLPIDVREEFLTSNHAEFAAALGRAGYAAGLDALMRMDPGRRDLYETFLPEESEGE